MTGYCLQADKTEVLDLQQLNEIEALGERAFVENLIHAFISECKKKLSAIKTCANNDKTLELSRLAHGLKSSALNIGAEQVVTYCQELEDKAECSDTLWISEKIESLQVAADESCTALLEHLENGSRQMPEKIAVSFH